MAAQLPGIRDQVQQRNYNNQAHIEGPLAHLNEKQLQHDVREFSRYLPDVEYETVLRAARVAQNSLTYEQVARNNATQTDLLVTLTQDEMDGLVEEQDDLRRQYGHILPVVLTVGCAAFLQGHVQASINCASLYAQSVFDVLDWDWQWKLGAMNAIPFFIAATVGAPSALLFNYWMGRRGAITVAALMILASSLGSAWTTTWWQLLCVRIVGGIGMGIKAVSAPILASEIAFAQWRGSSTLMWQLWVAFGIAIGSLFNLAISKWNNALGTNASSIDQKHAFQQILGAPFIPAVILLIALFWCMESPRYYMQPGTPHRNPARAYEILLRARQTQLQALRDLYLLHKSVELDALDLIKNGNEIELREHTFPATPRQVESRLQTAPSGPERQELTSAKDGLTYISILSSGLHHSSKQYLDLWTKPKLKNAMLSTCVVALAQQLCGINVFAFYSNTFFASKSNYEQAMGYSAGFGAVNFVFGLLAVRRIDTWGRRKLMLTTLPLMSLFLAVAALVLIHDYWKTHISVLVVFIYLFSAVYSPSLGPIPFTLASESFPLAQREAGCSVAIAVNLFFAGVLTLCYPELDHATKSWGGLALFSGLNLVAFVLVFFLVEETKGFELEELSVVFAVPKRDFIRFQLKYLHYLWCKYALGKQGEEPELYTVSSARNMANGEGDDSDESD